MALKEIVLVGNNDGEIPTDFHAANQGNGFLISFDTYNDQTNAQTAIWEFPRTLNWSKFSANCWYSNGFNTTSDTWLGPGKDQCKVVFYVIPEGKLAVPTAWIAVGVLDQRIVLFDASNGNYYGGNPFELRMNEDLSIQHKHQGVIRADGFAIEYSNLTSSSFEVGSGAFGKIHDLICWEDDSDYFLGWPITLVNSTDGTLDSTDASHDGDWATADTDASWGSDTDIVWTFSDTTLARARIWALGTTTSPLATYGSGGYMKVYYKNLSDAWVLFFTFDSTLSQFAFQGTGASTTMEIIEGAFPGVMSGFDIKLATPVSARGLKIEFNNGEGGTALSVYEVQAYSGEAKAMTVKSDAYTAETAPTQIRALVTYIAGEAITLNTDLIVSVSRDGGTTYTAVTLANETQTFDSTSTIATGSASVSSQPSGTSIKWKAVTTAKKVQVKGVSLSWA